MENYIFSGIGHAVGRYKVSNDDIFQATQKGLLSGFDADKVLQSKNYQAFLVSNPDVSPFDYFAKYKMGFEYRQTVVPFPPKKKHHLRTETSTEMAVRAIEDAFLDSGIGASQIDAWFVSTVSPHEQAPGIAATIKTYFVDKYNLSPTFTLTSGCSGFNLNLERAVEYLQTHPNAQHVLVAHTETMSSFLTEKSKFVSFVTFGDGAGAIVLSKVEGIEKEGVVAIENFQDLKMIDYVGVDKLWNLYMGESIIKDRAIENLIQTSRSILSKVDRSIEQIDMVIPHQTGNSILLEVAKVLHIPSDKLYLEAQRQFGNVSGSTVLLSLSLINKSKGLKPGMQILSAAAGVGGKYGAFYYKVPQQKPQAVPATLDLEGKTALVLGATGGLGQDIVNQLHLRGAQVLIQYRNEDKLNTLKAQFKDIVAFKANLDSEKEVISFCNSVKESVQKIDFLIFASGQSGPLSSPIDVSQSVMESVYQINFEVPVQVYQNLFEILKETVLILGSAAEDAMFSGSSAYVAAKRALHGYFAGASWEAHSKGLQLVYYMPGVVNTGMTDQLNEKQIFMAMQQINQSKLLNKADVAQRVVQSLYHIKVRGVDDTFENIMTVRRDGYEVTDGRW